MRIRQAVFATAILILVFAVPSFAQVTTGTPPFSSSAGGPDMIDLANLNAHISVPIANKAGRGMFFTYGMSYDSSVWYPVGASGSQTWQPVSNWGWRGVTEASTGYLSENTAYLNCYTVIGGVRELTGEVVTQTGWVYHDFFGVPHPFAASVRTISGSGCIVGALNNTPITTGDGSGYTLYVNNSTHGTAVLSRGGQNMNLVNGVNNSDGSGTVTDANGNEISVSSSGVFTDTLGQTALTVSYPTPPGPSNPTTFTYTAPSGAPAMYTMKYGTYTVLTNFGCSGISEYSASSVSLVSEIDLPDTSKYTFTYEATPGHSGDVTGRIASVALPTGGTISYSYSGGSNGIVCADGSTATLTRGTPDGTWSYAHSESGTAWITTVTDPQSNVTTINFQGIYETERLVYQGGSTLLKTVVTCYNSNTTSCNTTAITLPITQRTVTVEWPGTSGQQLKTSATYNSYGLPTEKDEYAYGPGSPGSVVRKTLIAYASLGNGIVNKPSSVTVEDGSSNVKSKATYCYDEGTPSGTTTCAAAGSPTATSGTPQHVAITGSRGNPTTAVYLVSGTTTLGKTLTYYDTGNPLTATDMNGSQTTYSYSTGSCGNSFATSISEPLSLSRSMTWNCVGGVETSVTDENSKTTSTNYTTDAYFWRPDTVTDPLGNALNYYYQPNPTYATPEIDAHMSFSNLTGTTEVSDIRYFDGLGRVFDHQKCEDSTCASLDTVSYTYDSDGRPYTTSLPCATGFEGSCSTPQKTVTYDGLGRKVLVTDNETPNPRSLAFSYSQNDTYRTLGPAPTGENTKRKQYEYDALGRLTSVCEVTSLTGSGTCGQTNTATGYWTQYTYDLLNDLTGVTQNAQSTSNQQTRTYTYDDLRRMTSETNPETGTTATTYTYDTDTTCGTSKGDLVKKVDQVGNTVCYAYDALHRITSVTYPSGSYASVTPSRHFVYDAATVNSVAMANAKTHMAEAYTCFSPCSTKLTDLGMSYTARGEVSDTYESTPNSGAYNRVNQTYWPSGAPEALSAQHGTSSITGLPTITYNLDGEGRIYSASASAGQNPLSSTTYNPASEPTAVDLGSSDSDTFSYDPNTDRMAGYSFNVNGQSVTGTLSWNPIDTLGKLVVVDPFNSTDAQTCTYGHDDLSRIASDNCGTGWSQTFTYDAFGNVNKSGTQSFQPTYSLVTNHMTLIGTSTPTYDANGNVTNDFLNTYAWDANSRPVTVDSVGLTYDALGRMVEQNRSGTYSQIVYTPTGAKLAILQTAALQKAFVPLTGGSVAVYNSSGLAYYRHSDWIGSSRFASTPTRTLYYDGAHGPFGEGYAQSGTTDLSFTGMNQDTAANVYDFPAREYGIQGRWPSPDPAGLSSVQINDPQTLNRYGYVRNSPLQVVDPTGMVILSITVPGITESDFPGGDLGDPSVLRNGGDEFDGLLGTNTTYGQYLGVVANPSPSVPQPPTQAQLEKYYEAFLLIAANQGIDPDQTVDVDFRYYAMTYDVSIDMSDMLSDESIDPQEANADATMQDPLTFLHDGADSYYYGSLWTDSGHLVDSNEDQTMNAHIDPFGPLNPLHYLLQIPSMLLGSGPSFSGTCSVNGGCLVNP